MNYRIEISPLRKWRDSRGEGVKKQISDFLKLNVEEVRTRDVYTISADISEQEAMRAAADLSNPVLQRGVIGESQLAENELCDWLISVGFKPGVTDNVGRSAHQAIGDIVGRKLRDDEYVFSSVEYMLYGKALARYDAEHIAKHLLANELIESVSVLSGKDLINGIPLNLPFVTSSEGGRVKEYNLEVSDAELMDISRKGILALSLDEMTVIQQYFRDAAGREKYGLKKNPTDVELEVLAQTWSEHCKHKIFDAEINYEDLESGKTEKIVSCYKSFIKKSTHEIGEQVNWLVSVFHDNAGVIAFNDHLDLVYKVETHNSPSALDPYGGASTGESP
jgi:phosphoribosylformylglycinamidine synthase